LNDVVDASDDEEDQDDGENNAQDVVQEFHF